MTIFQILTLTHFNFMKNLYKSLSEFQNECPVIHKGTQGYGYSYANRLSILKIINPLLKKHGLGYYQLLEGDGLKTCIFHIESQEKIESFVNIPQNVTLAKMNTFQVYGSAYTYYSRYALSMALGLITDIDLDASGEETPKEIAPVKTQLTSKTYEKMMDAINNGQGDSVKKVLDNYSMSEQQRITINLALKNV